jgi:hypothetical protein
MKYVVYSVAAVGLLAFSGAGVLTATAWGQAPSATAPVAPAQPEAPPIQAAPPNTAAQPPALAQSPVCPPAHPHVARVQHHYRRHVASNVSRWETRSEVTEVMEVPTQIVEEVPVPVVQVPLPPPVFVGPRVPPPPPAPVLYGPRPWYPAPWHQRWGGDWY